MSSKRGPIIIIDDDQDDIDLLTSAIKELGYKNEILAFLDPEEAYFFLIDNRNVVPFIIICDYNLPKMTGVQLKAKIDDDLIMRKRSTPFIFHSTSGHKDIVDHAYQYSVQGYFVKPTSHEKIKSTLKQILEYWSVSMQP
jgi:CheY-like chemotaxis protein